MLAAVKEGDAKELAELMRQDPGFTVNMAQNDSGWTLLHFACGGDLRSSVISLLLAHPDIDVNAKDDRGCTPFYWACLYGYTSCVREMLKDSRVNLNEPHIYGYTPLLNAAGSGLLDIIKWWIASGREMVCEPGEIEETDAVAEAKRNGKTEVAILLERFKSDAAQTRHMIRMELNWYDKLAAEMFAVVVFVSDGLLQVNDTTISTPAARSFRITTQLPLELQMVLCFRQVGLDKEIIPGKDSEVAFKELARKLW